MDYTAKLNSDLKEAMKAKDQAAMRSIRAIKAAILLAETESGAKKVDEKKFIQIVQKLIKQRKDSLEIYEKQGREDLAVVEREEIRVLEEYLPEQLSKEELEKELKAIIDQVGAESMKDMGKVMGVATQKLAGRADGKTISSVVKELLS
ncbi:MAG: GatB/YqeY domain-containing protein [Saprospiraceae bacterium]|nr:GatB/YqeY domain-containing protein [Saprospiraceae bacterium]